MKFFLWTLICVMLTGLCSGCGGNTDGPKRFEVAGTVTFDGKPVSSGSISFVPLENSDVGSGFATITDGQFDTSIGGRGHLGGRHLVEISSDVPEGARKPPFGTYSVEVTLPSQSSTQDFEVTQ